MKRHNLFYLIPALTLTLGAGAFAASQSLRLPTPKGVVEVKPVNQNVFRVTLIPSGDTLPELPLSAALENSDPSGVALITEPDTLMLVSPTTRVKVSRADGHISFHDAQGNLLLAETSGINNSAANKTIGFLTSAGHFQGAGERGHSPILNGDSLTFYNRQNYGYTAGDPRISQMGISIPFLANDKGYGILVDDFNAASTHIGADSIIYSSETPFPLSYYFINSPEKNLRGVTSRLSTLTGRQGLPPFWTLGYITSKYGYHNEAEARGAVDSLKRRGYPLDGMVLDLYWYGVEHDMGRLAWDSLQWPSHRKMISDLKEQGVNLVLISQPYVNKKGAIDNYNYLSERGMLAKDSDGNPHDVTTWVGDAGMIDVSNPKTRQWLWERLKPLTEEGIAGWWGDLGEPEVHPLSIVHDNGLAASQYHNIYGNQWSEILYEGLRRDFPDQRPMLMMRGGTTGLQRYNVFPWTTDVSRSWGGLKPQVNLMISAGLSGLGYMGSDVGGFAVDPANPTDEELYVRWLQMGTFSPMLRTHAQNKPEPYHYPNSEAITKRFINMRYQWLPYNYTLAYENAALGMPLARPLNFNGDARADEYALADDEYLWGDNILVAPVMEKGARSRKVLFPGGEWISWWSNFKTYQGGKEYTVPAPLNEIPLFVKAGSFIPQYEKPMANTTEYDPQSLWMRYYPSNETTEYTLFEDDRKDPLSLENGKYLLTYFKGHQTAERIFVDITDNGGSYPDMPQGRLLTLRIEGVVKAPLRVLLDGQPILRAGKEKNIRQYGYSYETSTHTLSIKLPFGPGKPTAIIVEK